MVSAAKLIELAKDRSINRRRELMNNVVDLYFLAKPQSNDRMLSMFDEVMGQLAHDLENEVRVELSHRIALSASPPRELLRSLALDASIDVARPILQLSAALEEKDLLAATQAGGEAHLMVISQRANLPTSVTDVIVERASDQTLEILLSNASAELSRAAHERLVDRAIAHPVLHEAVVRYAKLPIDLLNEMYFIVEPHLRKEIVQRNARINPEELEEALRKSRERVTTKSRPLPEDFVRAGNKVRRAELNGALTPRSLVVFLRSGETTAYLIALSQRAGVNFDVARTVHERRELDALSIICKAADLDRGIFVTLSVLTLGSEHNPMGRAREFGEVYDTLPSEVARRTVRFWGGHSG